MLHQRACREVIAKIWFIRFQTSLRSNSQQVCVRLLPSPRCFFDEPVHVKVDGLSPHQKVELRSKLKDDKGVTFRASALVAADASGQVDLCRSPSLGGSYTGVESMGLFWAMAAETPHSKLLKKNVLASMMVDIEVLHGDTGQGPFPGVLDVYTLGGGISEVRASLLANKGIVVLALAYYGFQDMPRTVPKYFDLEYFEEAITFLRRQPQVQGPGIGILSISKSGDLALSMASFLSGISATAWINGSNANTVVPLHYKDLIIPSITPIVENVTFSPSGILDIRDALPDPETEGNRGSVIPIERSSSRFLFAASEDDRNWNSCLFAQQAAARLRHHGKENFEVVMYPRAGHFLEVPYMPHCPSGFHPAVGQVVVFGGEAKAHHQAQLDLWRRVQEFFRKHLDGNNTAQKATLYTRGPTGVHP
ncbi:acyl-coenzyme A thioesterase 1 isoform X2 [Salmo trutta]|uniref:acyl-coenzyme A thioesterase 1 isoform X2 n=1 Tax=Salmo trutta TaxID=8032 RepID=UPI001130295F|nr:acyl-coenzyme A thioesterase 1-like isoform X2 [Salmo trutta]